MADKVNGMGIADVLIIGAELLHEWADTGAEAEASVMTTLKSSGKRYKATLQVVEVSDEEEL